MSAPQSAAPTLPRLFTLAEVAEVTRQKYSTVLYHVQCGRLHTVRPGGTGRHLVTEDAFNAYLQGDHR